jgi:hypothetical protein
MEKILEILKLTHALTGFVVLITGLAQIIMKKGGKAHRTIGQIYFWSWIPLIATGAIIGSLLITFFGLLGFYMVFMGYRFGVKKSAEISAFDKVFISSFTLGALFLLVWGVLILLLKDNKTFGIIAVFFGAIFTFVTIQDFLEYVLNKKLRKLRGHKMEWYFEHYGRMYISFMAATTAFAAIQNIFFVELLNWILPTLIGTTLLIITNKRNFKKFNIQ